MSMWDKLTKPKQKQASAKARRVANWKRMAAARKKPQAESGRESWQSKFRKGFNKK